MRHRKICSVEPWIENVGETGCKEPDFKQNTKYDQVIQENLERFSRFCSSENSLEDLHSRILPGYSYIKVKGESWLSFKEKVVISLLENMRFLIRSLDNLPENPV